MVLSSDVIWYSKSCADVSTSLTPVSIGRGRWEVDGVRRVGV